MGLNIKFVAALPDPLVANTIYFVNNAGKLEATIVGTNIASPAKSLKGADVSALITAALVGYETTADVNSKLAAYQLKSNLAGDVAPLLAPYVTNTALANALLNYYTKTEADAAILTAIGNLTVPSAPEYVANIAARDALTPADNMFVLVADATGDATVAAGAALYFYVHSTTTWVKVSEYESMDIANTSLLADLSDIGGKLAYKGVLVNSVTVGPNDW